MKYGICYGEEAFTAQGRVKAKLGHFFVDDVITGKRYQIPEKDIIDFPLDMHNFAWPLDEDMTGGDAFDQYCHQEYMKALEASKKNGNVLGVGTMITTPVGDGSAFYVVTEVRKKTCRIEWRGFHPDRWHNNMLGRGGSFPVDMISRLPKVGVSLW